MQLLIFLWIIIKVILFNNQEDFDFGFVHIKAVDEAGHDKSYDLKINALKKSDDALLYFLK